MRSSSSIFVFLVVVILLGLLIWRVVAPVVNKVLRPRVDYLFIHCTATKAGVEMTGEQLRRFHTSPPPSGRGWSRVGYTDMIHLDGSVERLAPNDEDDYMDFDELTNGAKGYNHKSRHIVYVGGVDVHGKPADTRTKKQAIALEKYVREFVRLHPHVRVLGHREVTSKACPSFDVQAWLRSLGLEEHMSNK